jgi:hypothetical protein
VASKSRQQIASALSETNRIPVAVCSIASTDTMVASLTTIFGSFDGDASRRTVE